MKRKAVGDQRSAVSGFQFTVHRPGKRRAGSARPTNGGYCTFAAIRVIRGQPVRSSRFLGRSRKAEFNRRSRRKRSSRFRGHGSRCPRPFVVFVQFVANRFAVPSSRFRVHGSWFRGRSRQECRSYRGRLPRQPRASWGEWRIWRPRQDDVCCHSLRLSQREQRGTPEFAVGGQSAARG